MPQTSLGELFTSVMNTVPNEETVEAKANTADPVFTGSISLGRKANTTVGYNSIAIGQDATASGALSQAKGFNVTASGIYSNAVGIWTTANGTNTYVAGMYNQTMTTPTSWIANTEYNIGDVVLYYGSIAICTVANSDDTFNAEKWKILSANTVQALAIGNGNSNSHSNALTLDWTGDLHLMGDLYTGANADGTGGTKLDTSTLAPKASPVFTGSISLGRKASTTVGSNSFAVGNDVEASADNAHAEGNTTRAAYVDSHAEGWGSEAISQAAHAEGRQGRATAFAAHAEGCQTAASGYASHAQGMGTQATNKSQHVAGEYNVADPSTDGAGFRGNYAEIIGNGVDANNRSNARALDWSGNEYIAGDLYVGCSADSTSGTKLARIPVAPSTDGTYTLQCVVTNGEPTYTWISTGA